jgi:hypothetical protein
MAPEKLVGTEIYEKISDGFQHVAMLFEPPNGVDKVQIIVRSYHLTWPLDLLKGQPQADDQAPPATGLSAAGGASTGFIHI